MNKFLVILKSVYKRQVFSGGFLAMVFAPLLLIGFVVAVVYFAEQADQSSTESTNQTVAIVADDSEIVDIISTQIGADVDTDVTTIEAADEALANEEIDGYADINMNESGVSANVVIASSPLSEDNYFVQEIQMILQAYQSNMIAENIGLSPEELTALQTPPVVTTESVTVSEGEISDTDMTGYFASVAIAYVLIFLMYFLVIYYSTIIATEVASEKGLRVMEIILSSTNATAHFFGKVVGTFLVLTTQLAIYGVMIAIALPFIMQIDTVANFIEEFDVWNLIADNINVYSVIFFLVGMLTYVMVSAFLGSLASKPEDASTAVTPVTLLTMVGFFGAMYALTSPESTIVSILSYIPFFSPFVMPMRVSAAIVPTSEIVISLVISVVTMIILTVVSVNLYRSNVLVYSNNGMIDSIKKSFTIWRTNREAAK